MTAQEIALGINSALYTLCCFAAGLAIGNGWAWRLAIGAFACQTLAGVLSEPLSVRRGLYLGGFGLGILAGIALLF